MKLRGLPWQSIDLTHRCNLHCDWCGKLTHESDYEMTMEQMDSMLKHINLATTSIRVSGGEPLIHPQFNIMMENLLCRFNSVNIATNGTEIRRMSSALANDPRVTLLVSSYGTNKCDIPHVNSTPARFYDPRHDPDLGEHAARSAYEGCAYHQIKVIGDKVYDCCHAETVERGYGGVYHAIVGPDWQAELESIERWPACQHCFMSRPELYERTY